MKTGDIREVMWLRHGEPVLDGWRLCCDVARLGHHGTYSVLIERVAK